MLLYTGYMFRHFRDVIRPYLQYPNESRKYAKTYVLLNSDVYKYL